MSTRTLSFVIPLLDEEESLPELHQALRAVIDREGYDAEILFIDDGSRDASYGVIRDLAEKDPCVKAIRFRRNFGKSAGLNSGFAAATGDVIITMDADLQDDPEEVPNLLAKLDEGYDLVTGWKRKRHDPISKTWPSKVFNRLTSAMAGLKLHDYNCGLKAYRREVVQEIRMTRGMHRFIPALAHWKGFRVAEIPVQHHPRQHGVSKYGAKRFIEGILDLMTVMLLTRYVSRPLRFFGWIGALFMGSGFVIELYITYLRIMHGSVLNRYPLLWAGVLLIIVGLQLLSTGLLAELVASVRTYESDASVSETIGLPEGAEQIG